MRHVPEIAGGSLLTIAVATAFATWAIDTKTGPSPAFVCHFGPGRLAVAESKKMDRLVETIDGMEDHSTGAKTINWAKCHKVAGSLIRFQNHIPNNQPLVIGHPYLVPRYIARG